MYDQQNVWNTYTPFHSSANVQEYLYNIYQKNNIEKAEKKSYENCYPFLYYLEHAKSYYHLSVQATLSIKPVLLFYGMTQLLKACLLSVDPQYPDSTSVLAHGVSTRKRKKQSYDFLKDEVKIQKNGLFSHFAEAMFQVEQLDGEKITMVSLLKRIPELNALFDFSYREKVSLPLEKINNSSYRINSSILDHFYMTESRFIAFLTDYSKGNFSVIFNTLSNQFEISCTRHPLTPLKCYPFYFNYSNDTYYLTSNRELTSYFPEVMAHYLLLYNLSMISRYETEWWSELIQNASTKDLPFIQQFIQTTSTKIPYLLSTFLYSKMKGQPNL